MTEELAAMIAALNGEARAPDIGDDTVRYYMSKSDVVLTARLKSRSVQHGANMTTYKLVFTSSRDDEVYRGRRPGNPEIKLNLVQSGEPPTGEASFPFTEGKTYFLFLKYPLQARSTLWRPADPWFSVQPAYRALGKAVARLAGEDRKREANDRHADTLYAGHGMHR